MLEGLKRKAGEALASLETRLLLAELRAIRELLQTNNQLLRRALGDPGAEEFGPALTEEEEREAQAAERPEEWAELFTSTAGQLQRAFDARRAAAAEGLDIPPEEDPVDWLERRARGPLQEPKQVQEEEEA